MLGAHVSTLCALWLHVCVTMKGFLHHWYAMCCCIKKPQTAFVISVFFAFAALSV